MKLAGLSHSEIHGLTPACGSPWLIATCYVLHRLLAPRHPPQALSSLITKEMVLKNHHSANCIYFCPIYVLPMCSCQRTRRTASPGLAPRQFASVNRIKQVSACAALRRDIFRLAKSGGRDWIRTSDPALIKRML